MLVLLLIGGCTLPVVEDDPEDHQNPERSPSRMADHSIVPVLKAGQIPESAIQKAIDTLHIGYGHTSHGSQVTDGMAGLVVFANNGHLNNSYTTDLFVWNRGGAEGALDLYEGSGYSDGHLELDAGYSGWDEKTRDFLDDPEYADYNTIIWSFCGQLSGWSSEELRDNYLDKMAQLEIEYPEVTFVYMTGHLDGTGESGNLHLRNEEIREYCISNNTWLFDFADIESYDPDGISYLEKYADDGCNYDSDGDGSRDRNWAADWQNSHIEGVEWYSCDSAHSQALNANMKAYAAWWLFARIAGWSDQDS